LYFDTLAGLDLSALSAVSCVWTGRNVAALAVRAVLKGVRIGAAGLAPPIRGVRPGLRGVRMGAAGLRIGVRTGAAVLLKGVRIVGLVGRNGLVGRSGPERAGGRLELIALRRGTLSSDEGTLTTSRLPSLDFIDTPGTLFSSGFSFVTMRTFKLKP